MKNNIDLLLSLSLDDKEEKIIRNYIDSLNKQIEEKNTEIWVCEKCSTPCRLSFPKKATNTVLPSFCPFDNEDNESDWQLKEDKAEC